MEDDGKLILWGTLVVLLLIIIGVINPFLLILILSILIYMKSEPHLFYWNVTKFEISVITMPFTEIEKFVTF